MDGGLGYGRRGLNELIVLEAVGEITCISRCEEYVFNCALNIQQISESRSWPSFNHCLDFEERFQIEPIARADP